MVPYGVLIDCGCVLVGANIGALLKKYIPNRIKNPMNMIFGLAAIVIGVISIVKLKTLPAVILSIILAGLIGEIFSLEFRLKNGLAKLLTKVDFIVDDRESYISFYVLVMVTLCASGTNIFGAINESITGDFTILLSKAVMDIFASIIFGATLGFAMNFIVLLQTIIMISFYYLAFLFAPYVNDIMLNNFVAVGGIITMVVGLNLTKACKISAFNLLPSLVLVWPATIVFCMLL